MYYKNLFCRSPLSWYQLKPFRYCTLISRDLNFYFLFFETFTQPFCKRHYIYCHCFTKTRLVLYTEKKEEIWRSSMTKTLRPTEKCKQQRDNIKNATKNFDYTTIANRLRTVSWSNSSHSTGVVKPVYERSTFRLTGTYTRLYILRSFIEIIKAWPLCVLWTHGHTYFFTPLYKIKSLDNDIKTKSISKTSTNYETKGKPKKCHIAVSNPHA